MKFKYLIFCLALAFVSCDSNKKMDSEPDAMAVADSLFQRNSEIVMADIRAWENETPDYSIYSDNYVGYQTGFGSEKDSISVEDMKNNDKFILGIWDFKLLTDPVVLLPGVNPDTKKPDGSVRYYGTWRVTRTATDSTAEKSGDLKMYGSYDFDENGKVVYSQMYADWGGLWGYLMSNDSSAEAEE